MAKILIFAEIGENGIQNAPADIISYCSKNFKDAEVNALVFAPNCQMEAVKNSLVFGFNNLYLLLNDEFDKYSTEIFAGAAADFLRENPHDIFLVAATALGRDLAPRIASKLDIGLTADCTEIGIDENNKLLATRPTYGGKLMATILSKTIPQFATIRPGALKVKAESGCAKNIVEIYPQIDKEKLYSEILSFERKFRDTDRENADIIIAGGRGMGSKENFELIYKLCDKIGAKPAASRCAVELGWADSSIQVGQTGSSVAPRLYIALGISGAMQHLVGIENSDRIVAVNTDINAPIKQSSDVFICADAVETVKSMLG